MKSALLVGSSFLLSSAVIGNAYYQKKQFYPSVVYLTKSNPSMAVLYLQAFVCVVLMGKLMRKIFFGQLRAAEMEHLIERSWYAVTETCLAFTVFRDDFSPRFVALFTILLFLKCFHWLAEDRVEYMERSPIISLLFHTRVIALMAFLGAVDLYFVNHAYYSTLMKGASVQLVFGFEYAILLTVVLMTIFKYILHTLDLQSENPWENKAVYLLYTELVMGFIKVILYLAFMTIMIKVHTFPLFAIRPMYISLRAFKKALHDVIMSRRAIRNMNTLYPDATPEELQSGDNVCIICREDMLTNCKKLPCNHIFHATCLRSWFQRQQTCPTCRMDVLRMPQREETRPAQPVAPAAAPPQHPQFPPGMFGQFPHMWMPGVPAHLPPHPQQQPPQATTGASTPTTATTTAMPPPPGAMPGAMPGMMPGAMPGMMPGMVPGAMPGMMPGSMPLSMPPFMMTPPMPSMQPSYGFPRPPVDLHQASTEDLRTMEGDDRANIEARLEWLHDIQTLLDTAMMLINQYNTVAEQHIHVNRTIPTSSEQETRTRTTSESTFSSTKTRSTTTVTSAGATTVTSAGARPKVSNTTPAHTTSDQESDTSKNTNEEPEVIGAEGYSPPTETDIPTWDDDRMSASHIQELAEVRKRRLQRFSQDLGTPAAAEPDDDNISVD